MDNETEPTTITEVNELFDSIVNEVYYGFNLKIVLMEASDEEIRGLQSFFQKAKDKRYGIIANPNSQE